MAEIIPNRVPCGNKNGNTTPQVTPVTVTTINGITYFKLKPDPNNPRYEGDYTKNCGLLGNEIDENFFYLRNMYIFTAYTQIMDDVKTLVLERVNGDKIYVNLTDDATYVVDDEGHILVDGKPIPDEDGEPVKFLVEGRDVHIVTDPSIQGDGSYGRPIGVDFAYRTGTYAPADFFVDLTCDDVTLKDFTDIGYAHSIVTRENVGRFGALYTFTQAQKLNAALKRLYGDKGWRVPSKEDWAKLLNWAEGCDGVQNHDTAECGNFGKFAGQRLKSIGFWNYDTEDKKPVDEFGFGVYPVGICPNDYNVAQPHSEFNFTGLYDVTSFWETDMSHNEGYSRKFSYGHNTVKQETNDIKDRNSIRLVRDIDGDFDVTAFADILGNYLPVILTTDGKQLWTLFNVGITNYDGFDEREVTIPKEWEDVNTDIPAYGYFKLVVSGDACYYDVDTLLEDSDLPSYVKPEELPVYDIHDVPTDPTTASSEYIKVTYIIHIDMSTEPKFYYNVWDGNMWHKKQMVLGESVVLLNEDYPTTCVTATTYVTSANTNHEWRIFMNEQTGLDEFIDTLEALKEEFSKEFKIINERIDDLSATTESLSAGTVAEIERLDDRIDSIEILEVEPEGESAETILRSYQLFESGTPKGVRIDIPKDKNIKSISTGWSGAVIDEATGEFTYDPESGDTEVVRVVYQRNDGKFELVEIDVDDFLQLDEFEDGLEVVESGATTSSKVVKVKIDPASDWFLTVSMSGVCLTGVEHALDNIAKDIIGASGDSHGYDIDFYDVLWENPDGMTLEEISALDPDYASKTHEIHGTIGELPNAKQFYEGNPGKIYLQIHDDSTDPAVDRYYKVITTNNYIPEDTTIVNAIKTLDAALKTEEDRATTAENLLDQKIDAETERAISAETVLHEEIVAETERAISAETVLHEEIVAETERAISAETVLHEEIVAETERAMSAETALQEQIDELSAATMELSASTVAEIERLDQKIDDEIARATAAEESISGDVTTLSAAVETFSAATVAELERLDGQDIADGDYTLTVLEGLVLNRKNGTDTITIGFDGDYGEFGQPQP